MKVEVKGRKSQEVDWTKNPQLLVSKTTGIVVLAHKDQSNREKDSKFVGIRLSEPDFSEYSNSWDKSAFQPFHGEITLKND